MRKSYRSRPPIIPGLEIEDGRIDDAIRDAFYHYRWKLELLPASLSGYWHPEDEKEVGGLLLHIERMVWFVNGYCEEFKVNNGTRDAMLAAAFFHDISDCEIVKFRKKAKIVYGTDGKKKIEREIILERNDEDFLDHPKRSAEIAKFFLERYYVPDIQVKRIMGMVASHMSHWYPDMPQPKTIEEKMIAFGDYLTTRKDIKIERQKKE